jgi:hypothetical protein
VAVAEVAVVEPVEKQLAAAQVMARPSAMGMASATGMDWETGSAPQPKLEILLWSSSVRVKDVPRPHPDQLGLWVVARRSSQFLQGEVEGRPLQQPVSRRPPF